MASLQIQESWLEKNFLLKERGATVGKEFRAALATFFTMSYILLVNPQILSKIGLSPETVVVSTALSSAVGCFLTGYFGNLPLGLAPGVGLSTYLTYGLIFGEKLSTSEAFTSCFISGAILLVFSLSNLSEILMQMIPRSVKVSTIVGMGMQIALVGMTSVKLVVPNEQTIVGLGDMSNYQVWLSLFGLILIGSLLFHQIEGGILLGIFAMTLFTWYIEKSYPASYLSIPTLNVLGDFSKFINFSDFNVMKCISGIAAFTFIGLIDVSGVIYGMAKSADLVNSDGQVPGAKQTFVAVSVATLVSAMTGGTPIIVYVESATGIKEGGRTGLTAVIIGALFIICLPIAPILASIPLTATSPVAILIGAMMMSQAKEIDWHNMSEAIPAFLTLSVMPFTFSITDGIIFGLIAAMGFYVTTGQIFADIRNLFLRRSSDDKHQITELSRLTGGKSPSRRDVESQGTPERRERSDSMFIDDQPFVRTPSLILTKKEADAIRK